MTTTENLGLKKPEPNDYVDVSIINENSDKLDDAVSHHSSQHASAGSDPLSPSDIGAYPTGAKGAVDCNTLTDGCWTISASAANGPGMDCVVYHKTWDADFATQMAVAVDCNVYFRAKASGAWKNWQVVYNTENKPSPKEIGAVAKTGDTMTGDLAINKQAPRIYLNRADGGSLFLECSGNDAYVISSEDGSVDNYRAIRLRNAVGESDADQALHYISRVNGAVSEQQILHTGNMSDLGVASIATGSYVGTGTYGESNPNSLTLPFEPKLLMIAPAARGIDFEDTNGSTFFHESAIWFAGTTKLLYRDSDTYYNTAVCTFSVSGNTISWYSNTTNGLARTQLNTSGKEYAYFAIG